MEKCGLRRDGGRRARGRARQMGQASSSCSNHAAIPAPVSSSWKAQWWTPSSRTASGGWHLTGGGDSFLKGIHGRRGSTAASAALLWRVQDPGLQLDGKNCSLPRCRPFPKPGVVNASNSLAALMLPGQHGRCSKVYGFPHPRLRYWPECKAFMAPRSNAARQLPLRLTRRSVRADSSCGGVAAERHASVAAGERRSSAS